LKAVQVVSRGKAQFVDAPKPQLQPGYVLVRPHLVALCGSDNWMLNHCPPEEYPFPPGTTGHELIAQVEAIDADHPSVTVGDLTLTIAPDHRAMAEFYLAPIENVLPLPAGKTPEELLMAQQLGTVIYACKKLPSVIGKTAVVIGQASAGLWFDVMLKRLGARRIVALDSHQHRLELSKYYGATDTIQGTSENQIEQLQEINDGELADIVVVAAGKEEAINLGIELAKNDEGFILQFGVPHHPVTVDYSSMFFKCLDNKSIVHASREKGHTSTIQAMELISSGFLDVSPVLTHRYLFEQVMEAYELQKTGVDGAVKILVDLAPT
jgi:L-iditol 2-dehydrogenase